MKATTSKSWKERDNQELWEKLARPYKNPDQYPRIGVVIYGLGTSAAATTSAIQRLPGAVTLAFSPYASGLRDWINIARAAGHEALLMIPIGETSQRMSGAIGSPELFNLEPHTTLGVLSSVLSQERNYIGVTNYVSTGPNFEATDLQSLFKMLKAKGLLFLESRPTEERFSRKISREFRLPFAANKIFLDNIASRAAIRKRLRAAEQIAQNQGEVIVMGFFYPVTLELIVAWTENLDLRGFSLAPISALVKQ